MGRARSIHQTGTCHSQLFRRSRRNCVPASWAPRPQSRSGAGWPASNSWRRSRLIDAEAGLLAEIERALGDPSLSGAAHPFCKRHHVGIIGAAERFHLRRTIGDLLNLNDATPNKDLTSNAGQGGDFAISNMHRLIRNRGCCTSRWRTTSGQSQDENEQELHPSIVSISTAG